MKRKLTKVIAVAVLALSLGSGVASAATGTIGTTGPNSNNQVTVNNAATRSVQNRNNLSVYSSTYQRADTGDVDVTHNTTAGSARSGDAVADAWTGVDLDVRNTGAAMAAFAGSSTGSDSGSINNTGPDSNNQVTFNNANTTTVENDNCIRVTNHTSQNADSGNVTVSGNTTGGSATSGDATAIATTDVSVRVEN